MPKTDRADRPPRVLLAGTFEPEFARNRVIRSLLERAGFDVAVLRRPLWGSRRYALVDSPKLGLALRGVRAYASLVWALCRVERPDAIMVLYPGYFDMPLVGAVARLRRIPVVFDLFISLHDTLVGDRGLRSPQSLAGRAARLVDRLACRSARLVLADTPAHADFFSDLTGVARDRFRTLWLGAQGDVFHPVSGAVSEPNLVLFHGTFIRLQGLDTIVRAAKLLEPENVRFRLVGDGQERPAIEALVGTLGARNVELTGLLPLERIPHEIAGASVCLGIFGTTEKAARVVPNKVFECIAMGRPVVTGDTPAIRAAFSGELVLVPVGDPEQLARALRELLAAPDRLAELGAAGRARFERDYAEAPLARMLAGYLNEILAAPTAPEG